MSKVILQPTANNVAHEHYINTILNPVPIAIIKNMLIQKRIAEYCRNILADMFSCGSYERRK